MALTAEPATFPYVLALRWLTADADEREQLIESVLTSDLVRLSPAAARGRDARGPGGGGNGRRGARSHRGPHAGRGSRGRHRARRARARRDRGRPVGARNVPDPLAGPAVLSASGRRRRTLVRRAARDRRRRRALRRRRRGRRLARPVDGGVRAIARRRRARPGLSVDRSRDVRRGSRADRARRRRHRARHRDRRGSRRRELPQPVPPGADVRPGGARAADLAVRAQPRPPGGRTAAVPDDARSRADPGRADRERDARRRVGRHVAVRRRAGHRLDADPAGPVRGTGVRPGGDRARGVARSPTWTCRASGVWRRSKVWPRSTSTRAAGGSSASWTDTGVPLHETIRVSYSKLSTLENCELQYVLSAELGLGGLVGYQAWVGKTIHKIIEDCENGKVERTLDKLKSEVDVRWRLQEFPSTAVSETWKRLAKDRMLPNWFERFGEFPATGTERGFEFAYDGATLNGYIDRIGPDPLGFGTRITDYKTGGTVQHAQGEREPAARHLLPGRARGRGPEGGRRDHGRRARVPEGPLQDRRHRDARMGGRFRRARGRVPAADARASLVADRRAPPLSTSTSDTGPTRRPIASSATSRRSARSIPQGAPLFSTDGGS